LCVFCQLSQLLQMNADLLLVAPLTPEPQPPIQRLQLTRQITVAVPHTLLLLLLG
jgi:hypothetical protein